jgi:hypothetical protein
MILLTLSQYAHARRIVMESKLAAGRERGIEWSDDALDMMASGALFRLSHECATYDELLGKLA